MTQGTSLLKRVTHDLAAVGPDTVWIDLFAGSEPSTMRMLFSEQAQPFFAQADLVEIGPLSDESVTDIVEDGFAATARAPAVTTRLIVATADGHPQRAMQLADAVWRLTPQGGEADESTWTEALDQVRAAVDNGCERLYAVLPAGHQRTLRAIASGGRDLRPFRRDPRSQPGHGVRRGRLARRGRPGRAPPRRTRGDRSPPGRLDPSPLCPAGIALRPSAAFPGHAGR